VFGNLQYVWIGVLTHYALDVIGSRRGIALFHPLSDTEYGMPTGVTTSSKYADLVTVIVTAVELAAVLGAPHLRRDPRSRYLGGRLRGGCGARNLRTQSGLRNGSCVTSAGSRRASGVDAHVVEPSLVGDVARKGRLVAGEELSIELLPGVLVREVSELHEPAELMTDPTAVDYGARPRLAEGVDDPVDAVVVTVELGPRLADGAGKVSIRRAEPRLVGGLGDSPRPSVLVGRSFVLYVSTASIRVLWAAISGRVSEMVAKPGCGASTTASCRSASAIAASKVM